MFGKNVLLLVPHPDDEVVACAATIAHAQAQGAKIFALYLTHGCLAQDTLWPWQRKDYATFVARRRSEAEQAAKFLKIEPVGWSARPARHVWRDLSSVYMDIQAAVARHAIDQLWVPAYEGGNADHDAINAIGDLFTDKISVLEFAEYNFLNGKAHSHSFPFPTGGETIYGLTLSEQQRKRNALAIYKSETLNLNYVKVKQECYRPLAAYDYSRAAHPGTLWYARFQWVPFHHPQVDFTKPADVSDAITAFLRAAANAPLAPAR